MNIAFAFTLLGMSVGILWCQLFIIMPWQKRHAITLKGWQDAEDANLRLINNLYSIRAKFPLEFEEWATEELKKYDARN